jgi:hypothetical protein
MYEKNEKLYRHKISQMKNVLPSFLYKPLVLTPKPETSNEEQKKGHTNGP